MEEISAIDRAALEQSLIIARAESPTRAKQIDSMLADEPWEQVARFAAFSAQIESLGLMPWQSPPCYPDMSALDQPYGDPGLKRASAELALRMRRCGVSRWHPHPANECDRIEAEERTAALEQVGRSGLPGGATS